MPLSLLVAFGAFAWGGVAHAEASSPTLPSASAPPVEASTNADPSRAPEPVGVVEPQLLPPPLVQPKIAPAPYSVPWQLRPIVAPTVLRAETSAAFYEDSAGRGGTTLATIFTGSYKVPGTGPASAGLAVIARMAIVGDDPAPGNRARGALTFVNPLLGAAYAVKLAGGFRLNAFLGATLPVGGGGGDTPSPGAQNSRVKGVNARAQMDNALFAVNDFTLIPGIGAAYVAHGLTVQVEATLLHLMRVRGEAVQKEASKTNLTMGLHVGYFVTSFLSVGAELRYQRWLNAPFAVEKDASEASRDTLSVAIGPRAHIKLGSLWLRPGIAYQRGLDKPLAAATPNYHIVQFDLPLFF